MKCPKCGLEVSNDADYCNRCGEPLNNPVVSNRRHISEGEHSKDKTGEEKVGLNGNLKYGTKHNEYICYECGNIMDRDENVVLNLLALI